MKTLQTQYNLLQEGKGHKDVFTKEAKRLFSDIVPNSATYDQTITLLKHKNIISEGTKFLGTSSPQNNFFTSFNNFLTEEAKAEEKKTTKEVEDKENATYDYKDKNNLNNQIFDQVLNGIRFELEQDPELTLEKATEKVKKNLAKNQLHYMEEAAFGVKGLGYTKDLPGLGEPKEPTGKYKSSGYGNLKENKMKELTKFRQYLNENENENKVVDEVVDDVYNQIMNTNLPVSNSSQLIDNLYTAAKNYLKQHPEKAGVLDRADRTKIGKTALTKMGVNKEDTQSEGRYRSRASDNDPRYLYPDLFKDTPKQVEREFIVTLGGDSVTVKASNAGEAKSLAGNIFGVPKSEDEYMTVKEKSVTESNRLRLIDLLKEGANEDLKEADKIGEVAALEAKINFIEGKIKKCYETMNIFERDDVKDFVDKKRMSEIKKDIKLLERAKVQLEKKYEKASSQTENIEVDEVIDEDNYEA